MPWAMRAMRPARPTAAFDAKFANFVIDNDVFTRLVCEGV